MPRRLAERGVRFIQIYLGGWAHHTDLVSGIREQAGKVDRVIAGLLSDLSRVGLLKDTLVLIGGEFGRTPYTWPPNRTARMRAGTTTIAASAL